MSKGLKQSAGRGEREHHVKGKIESRGVELVYPVGGEPGAQVTIATAVTRKAIGDRRLARVERELLAETNKINTTSGLLVFADCLSARSSRATMVTLMPNSGLNYLSTHVQE